MHEILIKLKLYGYKNDSNNVNFFYFRLFPAQWINGLQTVADADLQIRWGPGLPDSEIKRRGGGGGGWVGFLWSKNKRGRAPLLDPALIENVQSTK